MTLAHEHGFSGSNRASLLEIFNFDDVMFIRLNEPKKTFKQRLGAALCQPVVRLNAFKYRSFGVSSGCEVGAELVLLARRGEEPLLFDREYR